MGVTSGVSIERGFQIVREGLEELKPSRERSLVATKLDEAELWLTKCEQAEPSQ